MWGARLGGADFIEILAGRASEVDPALSIECHLFFREDVSGAAIFAKIKHFFDSLKVILSFEDIRQYRYESVARFLCCNGPAVHTFYAGRA